MGIKRCRPMARRAGDDWRATDARKFALQVISSWRRAWTMELEKRNAQEPSTC